MPPPLPFCRAHIEKVKAHVERRKHTMDVWTFKKLGNFTAGILAGPGYQEGLYQEGLKPIILRIPAVELLQQLVPSDL